MNLKAKRWTEVGTNRYAIASTLAAIGKTADALAAALGALDADKRGENGRAIPLDLAAAASLCAKLGKDADAWDYWVRSFDSALAEDDAVTVRKALVALVDLAQKAGKEAEKARYAALLAQLDAAPPAAQEAPLTAPPAKASPAKP